MNTVNINREDLMKNIDNYSHELRLMESSSATGRKYIHDIMYFVNWLGESELDKTVVIEYKKYLSANFKPSSVNSMLSSINGFFDFIGRYDLKVRAVRFQRQMFLCEEKLLTKGEYNKLLDAAKCKKDQRLYYLIQTMGSTGIRVSEVKYITIGSLKNGYADIDNKGKHRRIFIPKDLCRMLKEYCKNRRSNDECIFITKNGKPLDRSNIWHEMKALCKKSGVNPEKVFPHNLRRLFARTFYEIKKDISHLADILGHESINTTRIYVSDSGESCRHQLSMLGLLRPWDS